MLSYQTARTNGSLYALACIYADNLNEAVKADTLHPGMYAEYGVALALMGHEPDACRMLNAEAAAFPESKHLVRRLKERLLPQFVDDTFAVKGDTADLAKLIAWAYDDASALKPLQYVASVIDSTDSIRVMQQTPVDSVEYEVRLTANQKRQLLYDEQHKAELQRKATADSIAAAKQAKIDARKQADLEKKQAKEEKEKARKQADKEKKKAAKEKARQRDEEKQRKAAERKAQQKKQKGGGE